MAERIVMKKALRSGMAGFAVGAALVALGAAAQGLSGFNTDAPVNYAADRIELQDKQQRVVLSGNVDITQGDLRLRAGRTTVAYTDAGALKIQRLDATGGVVVTRGGETARGDVAIYDFNRRIITLAGNVALNRSGDTLNGGRLVIDLASGVSSVDGRGGGSAAGGGGGGRVTGSFSVPKRN
jgi:lipopolysaccharide export system protein LptA